LKVWFRCWETRFSTAFRLEDASPVGWDVEKLREGGTLDWHFASNLDPPGKSWIDSLSSEQIAKQAYWDIEEK
jgi:hypothetical protein